MFKKVQGRPTPLICLLVARLSVKGDTRRQRGSKPGPQTVYKWFSAKKATG